MLAVTYDTQPYSSKKNSPHVLPQTKLTQTFLGTISNLRKISSPANLDFFQGLDVKKKARFTHKLEKNQVTNWSEIFLKFETDLNFSRPWFSEIKVQIKRPTAIIRQAPRFFLHCRSIYVTKKPMLRSYGLVRVFKMLLTCPKSLNIDSGVGLEII